VSEPRSPRAGLPCCDLHVHTRLSHDGRGAVEEYCRLAIERGIYEIGFTEHVDFDPSDPGYGYFDYDACAHAVEQARRAYGGELTILFGVEVDYQEWFEDEIREFLGRNSFDYVVGSVHAVAQQPLMSPGYLACRAGIRAYTDYLEAVRRSAASGLFDVIGHLEYAARRSPDYVAYVYSTEYRSAAREALRGIVASGAVLEINASGHAHDIGRTYPSAWCLAQYRHLGGKRVTVGSDAHQPARVGLGVHRAVRLAHEVGLEVVERPANGAAQLAYGRPVRLASHTDSDLLGT
jgi:histidinol-phosphatase (PHP family)